MDVKTPGKSKEQIQFEKRAAARFRADEYVRRLALRRQPEIVRNQHCGGNEEFVIPWRCEACRKCWLYVASEDSKRDGKCPYDGPYMGYAKVEGDK